MYADAARARWNGIVGGVVEVMNADGLLRRNRVATISSGAQCFLVAATEKKLTEPNERPDRIAVGVMTIELSAMTPGGPATVTVMSGYSRVADAVSIGVTSPTFEQNLCRARAIGSCNSVKGGAHPRRRGRVARSRLVNSRAQGASLPRPPARDFVLGVGRRPRRWQIAAPGLNSGTRFRLIGSRRHPIARCNAHGDVVDAIDAAQQAARLISPPRPSGSAHFQPPDIT